MSGVTRVNVDNRLVSTNQSLDLIDFGSLINSKI